MERVYRYDKGTIEPFESGDSFLRAKVSIARDGVFAYLNSDGTIQYEAKLPEEIFSELTIQTAKGVPVTDGHPPFSNGTKGLITPNNYTQYVKGALGDAITVADGMLVGEETIYDAALIEDLKAGKKVEVSIGFTMERDTTPGEYNGQRYDAAQRNIRINHLAHVEHGRAGSDIRACLDSALTDAVAVQIIDKGEKQMNPSTPKTAADAVDDAGIMAGLKKIFTLLSRHDGGEVPPAAPDPAAPSSDDLAKRVGDIEKILTSLISMFEKSLPKISPDSPQPPDAPSSAALDSAIAERIKLIDAAKAIAPDVKTDGMSAKELKLSVIKSALPFAADIRVDALSDDQLNARYDAACDLAREKAALHESSEHRFDCASAEKQIADLKTKRTTMYKGDL